MSPQFSSDQRLPGAYCFVTEGRRASQTTEELLRPLLLSCSVIFHWPEQVPWRNKRKNKRVGIHEECMCVYVCGVGGIISRKDTVTTKEGQFASRIQHRRQPARAPTLLRTSVTRAFPTSGHESPKDGCRAPCRRQYCPLASQRVVLHIPAQIQTSN